MAISFLALTWAACSAPLRLAHMFGGGATVTPLPTTTTTPTPSATARPTIPPAPIPTIDFGPTPSPFPTFPAPTPSPTMTALRALDCRLEWQSPGNGWEIQHEEDFTTGWKITNTGSDAWSPGSVEFTYVSGAKLHRDAVVQLEFTVAPGESVILTAEMKAPRNSTSYVTYWSLRQADTYFCRVGVSIYVK